MLTKLKKVEYQITHIKASIAEYHRLGTVNSNKPIIDMLNSKLAKLQQLSITNPITHKEI